VGLEEGPLSHTEIISSSEYKSETESSTGLALPLYTSSPPSPPPPSSSPTPIDSLPSYHNNMTQLNFQEIIRQQQEQMVVMQVQIQALLAQAGGAEGERGTTGSNMGSHMEVAKPAIFNREAGRVGGFITACRLYIKMKLRGNTVEEQVQWVLTYV